MSDPQLSLFDPNVRCAVDRVVGFTGTRNGMTERQRAAVVDLLFDLKPTAVVHGDCIGADDDFDAICAAVDIERRIRPCTYHNMRAFCDRRGAKVVAKPKRPMARNRDIVADADVLIACPPNRERIKSGSGTWATIGFAKKAGIRVLVVFPEGDLRDG